MEGGGILLTTLSSTDEPIVQDSFAQQPPIPKQIFVQKLQQVQSNGDNMIFSVQYYADPALPKLLKVNRGENSFLTLKDDGIYPDIVANDYKYASFVKEDISSFVQNIKSKEVDYLAGKGALHFVGHDATINNVADFKPFDDHGFDNNEPTGVYLPILDVATCGTTLKKENSLFITDLAVVEDPARTNNITNGTTTPGNPVGAWTFGTLMKAMANEPVTNIKTKDFLKSWLKTYTIDQSFTAIGGNIINLNKRADVYNHLIVPWIMKAHPIPSSLPVYQPGFPWSTNWQSTNSAINWEKYWDDCTEASLLQNAPFKLMAIVNRLDLRQNMGYYLTANQATNGGETRFIFTLINPTTGRPPIHDNITAGYSTSPGGAIDWVGMNIILEYGNPIAKSCDLKSFAQQWFDLSSYPLGSATYNAHLQDITDQVVMAGKAVGKPNGSAINQIRTNEKIFGHIDPTASGGTNSWEPADWELRQYEIMPNGYLGSAPLTNTIIDQRAPGTSINNNTNLSIAGSGGHTILNWVYGANGNSPNIIRVQNGNYNLPTNMLDFSGTIHKEMTQFFDFDASNYPASVYNLTTFDATVDMPNQQAKNIRHQLSLNTCQGCHGGETKTNFTMMYPRGYGQEANYWDANPTKIQLSDFGTEYTNQGFGASIDSRFNADMNNSGNTYDLFLHAPVINSNLATKTANNTNLVLSAFITGRTYNADNVDNNNDPAPWEDDELDPSKELSKPDDSNTGLYFVNDPSNRTMLNMPGSPALLDGKGGPFPQLHVTKNKFNELERRKIDLCSFVSSGCGGSIASTVVPLMDIIAEICFVPFYKGAH